MHWRKGIGINANTAQYRWNSKNLNAGWVTTFNHHSIVSENRLTKISNYESISPAILSLLGCALTTAYGIASKETLPKQDDTILILGTGGVGLALIAILRTLKNERIIAVDKDVKKLKVASNLGASYTIKFTSKEQSKSDINLLLNQVGADIAIETTGKVSCIELAYEATKEDGFVNLVGVPDSNHKASLYTLPLHYGKILRGTDGGSSDPDVDIPLLIELLVNKSLILDSYPLTTYTLNDINKAIYDIRDGQPGRSIIQF
jgi:Zn-dependent alcohol dehydrogenase